MGKLTEPEATSRKTAATRRTISKRIRFEVLRAHNFSCLYCGAPAGVVQLEIDHVIPYSLGGSNDPWNLAPACVACNAGKLDTAPTAEMVSAARSAYLAVAGREYVRCEVCGVPLRLYPGDESDQGEHRCESCDLAICDAYDAGRRAVS